LNFVFEKKIKLKVHMIWISLVNIFTLTTTSGCEKGDYYRYLLFVFIDAELLIYWGIYSRIRI